MGVGQGMIVTSEGSSQEACKDLEQELRPTWVCNLDERREISR